MKTKYFLLTGTLILQLTLALGQWSTDPENPGIVSDFTGFQNNPKAFTDDNGGVFVFWLDDRLYSTQGAREIYGQHYNSDGYALWEEDGRLILNHSHKITWFNVSSIFNGEIIIGWVSYTGGGSDSLRIQRLDANGSKVWTNDLLVAHSSYDPSAILGFYGYHIIHDNSGYCIAIGTVYYGGSSGNRITRFTSDGILTGWYNGEPEGTQYNFGSSGLQRSYDAFDNIYLYYSTGNGAGAELMCLKVNTAGDTLWGPVSVLAGTSGLSYQFSGISDENGMTFVWQGNGVNAENLYARRLTADGYFDWSGSTFTICDAEGSQSNFYMKKSGNLYYVVWADGRPGVNPGYFDIYAQKFDINQNIYWAANGIEVSSLNTYIPYPKFEFADNNSIIVCHQSTVAGFVAQKVLDNGTLEWEVAGNQICIPSYNPFYGEHIELQSGNNVVAVWAKANPSGGADDIYISRIDNLGITGQKNIIEDQIKFYPNPASEKVVIYLPDNFINPEIKIIDSFGKVVITSNSQSAEFNGRFDISTSDLPAGIYILQVKSGIEINFGKLIIN
jgi:hypothetical protein